MYEPTTQKGYFFNGLAWLGGILAVCVILAGLGWGISFAWGWATAGPNGKLAARQQIQSGNYRIQAYNHFFDLCASVQTSEASLAAQEDLLKQATTAEDKSRIQTNIGALIANRADAVNQYNADAAKSYTVGQFRASGLPFTLPATYTKGVTTSCTA